MHWLFFVLLALVAAPLPAQLCCGDCSGDGSVTVNELVSAVGSALNTCSEPISTSTRRPTPTRTPTPATCPFRFNDEVTTDDMCGYTGEADAPCDGIFEELAVWYTSGTTVTVALFDSDDDLIEVYGQRTGPTSARVLAVAEDGDPEQRVDASGTISIPSADRLRVTFNAGTNCDRQSFDGTFDDFYFLTANLRSGVRLQRLPGPPRLRNFNRVRP